MRLFPAALVSVMFASAAWAQTAPVTVTEAWSRATTAAAQTAALYVTVTASVSDRLIAAATPAAEVAELHQSQMTDGVMEMRPVPDGLAVTPTQPIHMAPGGYHIMLIGLKQQFHQGERIPVALIFEHAGTVQAEAVVAGPGASQSPTNGR